MKESLDDLVEQLRQANTPTAKERFQVLYWLKQEHAPSISAIAQAVGKHRNTVQTWLSMYREGGVEAMLEVKKPPERVRVIPQWAEAALAKRLQEPNHGFTKLRGGATVVSRDTGDRGTVSRGLSDDSLATPSQTEN